MLTVCIVEDDEKIRGELAVLLKRNGYAVYAVDFFSDIVNTVLSSAPDNSSYYQEDAADERHEPFQSAKVAIVERRTDKVTCLSRIYFQYSDSFFSIRKAAVPISVIFCFRESFFISISRDNAADLSSHSSE